MRSRTLILIGIATVVAGCATGVIEPVNPTERVPQPATQTGAAAARSSAVPEAAPLPPRLLLKVPFASQAPDGDWADPRKQEGCEEMSIIMVHHYLEGTGLNADSALTDLLALSDWEEANGYGLDVNVAELAVIVEEYYGHKTAMSEDVTVENITQQLAAGNPVVVPAAGRRLGNPYFSGEGPWYHMLVITGYDSRYFYANDPGTRRGEGYRYEHDVLLSAVHDWTGVKEDIEQGRKVMLTLLP